MYGSYGQGAQQKQRPFKKLTITDGLRRRTNPFAAGAKHHAVSQPNAVPKHNVVTDKGKADLNTVTQAALNEVEAGSSKKLKLPPKQNKKEETPLFSYFPGKRALEQPKETPSLVIPKKHKPNHDRDESLETSYSLDKKLKLMSDKKEDNKINCPFCFTVFPFITSKVQDALNQIEIRNKRYKEKVREEEEDGGSLFQKPDALINRTVPSEEKDDFCKLHRIELFVKPLGKKKGYPASIDFPQLRSRVKNLVPELEKVIRNETHSDYRSIALEAYHELGVNKARSSIAVMARFESLLPGYYGPMGASIISDLLTDVFLASDTLTAQQTAPQKPHEYIQQVLIPETAYRLIKQDYRHLNISDERAKEIMNESVEFGEAINPFTGDDLDYIYSSQSSL